MSGLEDARIQGVKALCEIEAKRRGLSDEGIGVSNAFFNTGGAFSMGEQLSAGRAIADVLCCGCQNESWPEGWTSRRQDRNYDVPKAIALARAAAVALYLIDEGPAHADAVRDGEVAWQVLRGICSGDRELAAEIGESLPELKEKLEDPSFHPARDMTDGWLTRSVTRVRASASGVRPRRSPPTLVLDPDPWMPGAPPSTDPAERAVLASVLTAYASQFGSYTTLLWQVPALSLTAQAFLLTIVLTNGNGHFAKLTAAALSTVIAVASTKLMHDQRGHAMNHGELALRISRQLRLGAALGDLKIEDAEPTGADAETVWVSWDHRIYGAWKFAMYLFLVVDVVAFVPTFIQLFQQHHH
jgi:hypothetical protein